MVKGRELMYRVCGVSNIKSKQLLRFSGGTQDKAMEAELETHLEPSSASPTGYQTLISSGI
jgi:hypothetical protein